MTGPLKRRRQIMDDETGDTNRFNAREHEHAPVHEDTWVKNSIARVAALIRNIGGKR